MEYKQGESYTFSMIKDSWNPNWFMNGEQV